MRTIDERNANWDTILLALSDSIKSDIRVAMPGLIEAWDSATQTATVRLAIREKVTNEGVEQEMQIPLLEDVPIVVPRAGGYVLGFAPKKGDECLVIFADCCIDSWWQSGGVQSQADTRRHDLSDGFAVLGCWSQKNKPKLPSSGISLQNDAGTAGISISGDTVNIFGTVKINGNAYSSHRHSGVESGSSRTGGVV